METASTAKPCGLWQPLFESSSEPERVLVSKECGSYLWEQEQLPEPLFA